MTTEQSGVDLARQALRAAKDAAHKSGSVTDAQKRKRRSAIARTGGRDPQLLGSVLAHVEQAYDWQAPQAGASIIDRWQEIAPGDIANQLTPVHYDPERRILHVRPVSRAVATLLTYTGTQLVAHLNRAAGSDLVAALKVLNSDGGGARAVSTPAPEAELTAVNSEPAGPTGAPPTPEMLAWRERQAAERAARETKPVYGDHPLFADAYGRLREPEDQFADGVAAADTETTARQYAEDAHRRALAVARQTRRTGDPTPLRQAGAA